MDYVRCLSLLWTAPGGVLGWTDLDDKGDGTDGPVIEVGTAGLEPTTSCV